MRLEVEVVAGKGGLLDRYFYFGMSLLIAAIVLYGFSQTVPERLFHSAIQRPLVVYVHGLLFLAWVLFFIFQSALVRTRNVKAHRRAGWFGVALGVSMVAIGVSTAIVMGRFDILQLHKSGTAEFLIVPLFDMTVFSVCLSLAVYWRRKPEYHRRLLLVTTCAITSAAFGRFPTPPAHTYFYAGVDSLILLGVFRDLIVNKRIHAVYLYALPVLVVCQTAVVYTFKHSLSIWVHTANRLLGL